jgi:sec-independent protein translocase protein TatA
MPSLGFGEIVLILLIALIIFGPKRLPEMGRTIGRSLKEFRRAAADLRAELDVDLDEEPRASVEERANRLAENNKAETPEPPRGEAPPT